MAIELETAVRGAAERIARYVEDVATMTVETRYVEVGGEGAIDFEQARPVARTVVALDADCTAVLPMRPDQSGRLEVDAALFELHQRNVASAIEYRTRILNALLGALQSRVR